MACYVCMYVRKSKKKLINKLKDIKKFIFVVVKHYVHNKRNDQVKSLQCLQNKALKIIYCLPRNFTTISLYKDVCKTILPVHT